MKVPGRAWAYIGALLGGAVSIAANVAHSYVPPQNAPTDWTPNPGAVAMAVVWPVFLFVAIEILARVQWQRILLWGLVRFGGLVPVAVVAAVVSYRHLSGLLAWYGEDGLTVVIGPLAVDGLMVMATGALIATGRAAKGSGTTIAENTRGTRIERATFIAAPEPVDPWDYAEPIQPATVADTPPAPKRTVRRTAKADTTATKIARLRTQRPDITQKQVADKVGVDVRTVRRHWPDTTPAPAPDKPEGSEADTTTDPAPVNGRVPEFTTT